MGWDTKKNGKLYYYKSERRPGSSHPVKVYLGKGPEAEEAARQIEERRQERLAVRAALLEEEMRYADADQQLSQFGDLISAIVKATLRDADYYNHKGEWRRRRNGRDADYSRGQ
jgi:hypothetical protein